MKFIFFVMFIDLLVLLSIVFNQSKTAQDQEECICGNRYELIDTINNRNGIFDIYYCRNCKRIKVIGDENE